MNDVCNCHILEITDHIEAGARVGWSRADSHLLALFGAGFKASMVVHLVKLCVGVETVDQLAAWQAARWEAREADPSLPPIGHVTRMTPKRRDEIVAGGSLYWVIKGVILVRQDITAIENLVDADGIKRCRLVLGRDLILTRPHPRRPFQGWRYLKAEDAPQDLGRSAGVEGELPEEMRLELDALGLL